MSDRPSLDLRLRRLAAWADRFEAPGFTIGRWIQARRDADGVTQLPWFELSADGLAFVSEMTEFGWVYPFDWMRWLETTSGRALSSRPEDVASASADDLARLLTAIVRGERFAEGEIAAAFERGFLRAIAHRAEQLATGAS